MSNSVPVNRYVIFLLLGALDEVHRITADMVESDLAKLKQLAESRGFSAEINETELRIDADASESAPFNKAAFELGITLSSITVALPTLEETFFEMTATEMRSN